MKKKNLKLLKLNKKSISKLSLTKIEGGRGTNNCDLESFLPTCPAKCWP